MDPIKWNISHFVENENDCLNYIRENYQLLPYLNVNEFEQIPYNSLVRFRGMVQDMYDPEYYLQKCEIINRSSNTTYSQTGKYRDTINCKDDEELDLENKNNISSERHTFVVISTPAVNDWITEIEKTRHKIKHDERSSCSSGIKRPLENEEEMEMEAIPNKKTSPTTYTKITKPSLSKEHYLNFPIPGENGKACQVKVYENDSNIKLNEVYDFVGYLSTDVIALQDNENDFGMEMEIQTHNPPTSLIPRLHCVFWKKIEYQNPLVENISLNTEKIQFLRQELHLILTEVMMGDELAANYLLYHLLSRVYLRRDLMPLGTFTLNISNIPVQAVEDYGNKLYELLQILLPKSHYLPMTLENMNDLRFTPKKDYECNRLTTGLLQLSDGTHLVLDETKLSSGKLNESGVKAVSAINNIIKSQKVGYDFNYYTMEFDCDIPIFVLSEGKSLLPSDGQVVLKPSEIHVNTFNEIYEAVKKLLNPDLLNDIRTYLTISKYGQYEILDGMLKIVQNDFVNFRQIDKINADDLHQLLVLSRLICLSEGKSSLDEECWRSACDLEKQRKLRL